MNLVASVGPDQMENSHAVTALSEPMPRRKHHPGRTAPGSAVSHCRHRRLHSGLLGSLSAEITKCSVCRSAGTVTSVTWGVG